ncbi:MAG: molybdenum cofactor guanylyltransferase [Acidobacteriota bacterium]|nr:molybdenum cofactor guanylyltransferase [Acidobacteriota bacterium]
MTTNFTGYVLAGGKSSRMKTDKAFLKIGGETFLERAVNALSPVCENRVKIVINEKQKTKFEESLPSLDFVFDHFPERGALGGIHAALKDCETEFAIILACDLPLVSAGAIEILTKIALSDTTAAVVPRQSDQRAQPLCAAYRVKDCLPPLENLIAEKTSAPAREFLRLIPARFVEQKELSDDERLFFNVNHPADFASIGSD